jgi:hypothetical protein
VPSVEHMKIQARALLRKWPWRSSVAAGAGTLALMLLLYAGRPFRGITAASATNMSAFVFFLVGGVVLAASTVTGASLLRVVVRPPVLGLVPALACWSAVVLLRRALLAGEPLAETVFQDGLGRSIGVYQATVVVGFVAEGLVWIARRASPAAERWLTVDRER